MMLVWKKHWFETKFFNDKLTLANHRQELVMWLKTTQALTLWQSEVWCSKSNSYLTSSKSNSYLTVRSLVF